jgi:hypothetical protein
MRMDHPDDDTEAAARKGRECTPGASTASELVPWAATAESRRRETPSPRKRFTNAAARAVLVAAGLGVGAAVAHFALSDRSAVESAASKPTPQAPPTPESLAQRMTDALGALRSEVADLRATIARDQDEARSSAAMKRLDELAARFEKAKRDSSGSIAELTAKIDPFRQETAARLQAVVERLDRLERRAEAAPEPRGPGGESAGATEARKPPVIRGWILREVYDGVALVEGAGGAIEVAPGETLPGAGRVKSIERKGKGWIVVTSRGVIDHGPARSNLE